MSKKVSTVISNKLGGFYKYFIVVISVLLLISTLRNYFRYQSAKERVESEKNRITEMEKELEELDFQLKQSGSQEFIEKQLRDNLNMAKDNEIIVVLPDDEFLRKIAPEVEIEPQEEIVPNWKKWLELFL